MHSRFLLLMVLLAGQNALAGDFLYNLSSGSLVTVLHPILIHANNAQEVLSPGPRLDCSIRMRSPETFDRVIPENHRFKVREVHREALSSHRGIWSWTRIELESNTVDEIVCTNPKDHVEPRIGDFKSALQGVLSVTAIADPVLID